MELLYNDLFKVQVATHAYFHSIEAMQALLDQYASPLVNINVHQFAAPHD